MNMQPNFEKSFIPKTPEHIRGKDVPKSRQEIHENLSIKLKREQKLLQNELNEIEDTPENENTRKNLQDLIKSIHSQLDNLKN